MSPHLRPEALTELERGERFGTPEVFAALDEAYGCGGHLGELWEPARDGVFPERFRRLTDLERAATARDEYASATVPGLLQTALRLPLSATPLRSGGPDCRRR